MLWVVVQTLLSLSEHYDLYLAVINSKSDWFPSLSLSLFQFWEWTGGNEIMSEYWVREWNDLNALPHSGRLKRLWKGKSCAACWIIAFLRVSTLFWARSQVIFSTLHFSLFLAICEILIQYWDRNVPPYSYQLDHRLTPVIDTPLTHLPLFYFTLSY